MKLIDKIGHISTQDYGPFLEVITLYEHERQYYLKVSCGYGPESWNDKAWYKLNEKPHQPFDQFANYELFVNALDDQSEDFSEQLKVKVEKIKGPPVEEPW